ncbi:MAG: SDR family oxidoreductase [Planctomycetota bacterium]|nr:SDR family oxidoreductase [Planctomycetota bacterium]
MAHVLITGGCGFFGAWILRKLFDAGHTPTVWDLELNPKRWLMILTPDEVAKVAFASVRVDDPDAVKAAMLEANPDAVIHLAGLQVPTCKKDPIAGARVNVIGTLAVFEAARALPRKPGLAYASSAAVFGSDADYDHQAVGDASWPRPGTHYGAFKLCNELTAKVFWTDHGLSSAGFRPLTVYGPGRDVGLTSFPTRAVAAALLGQNFEIPFSGPTCYTHCAEVAGYFVAAALAAKREGAPVYTVGGEVADSKTFVEKLSRHVPEAKALVRVSGGDLPIASHLDDKPLRQAFPQVKRIGLDEGIGMTVEIFKKLKARGELAAG